MTFRVFWTPRGENQMRQLWTEASSELRDRFLIALFKVSEALTLRPGEVGESRAGSQRIAFFDPLVVTYDVDIDRRLVRIAVVRLFGPSKESQ